MKKCCQNKNNSIEYVHKLIIRKGEHMMKKLAEILQEGSIVRKKQRGNRFGG